MKPYPSVGSAALGLLLLVASPDRRLTAASSAPDFDVEVLDALLASVSPSQALVQVGDMHVRVAPLRAWRDRLAGGISPAAAFDGLAPLWPSGRIFYRFDSSVSAAKQRAFLDGAAEWAMFAALQFIPRTSQANYITVREVPGLGGGQSALGMAGGEQFLDLDPGAWNRATICHELGHALGLIHEHQRSDRDGFVTILTANILPGQEANFVRLGNSQNAGPYDFLSVMHYRNDAYSIRPGELNTIEPRPAYATYLNRIGREFDEVLSPGDRAGVAARYGSGPVLGSVVTNTLDSGPGSLRAALYHALDHPGTTITFNVPTNDPGFSHGVFTLQPTDNLPGLRDATVLDGASQPGNANPGRPAIVLNGSRCDPVSVYSDGLRLVGSNCVVQSLVINGFPGSGLVLDGTNATHNEVRGCYVGVDPIGTTAVTNRLAPIVISGGARHNRIGGPIPAARNVFAGSASDGVVVRGPGTRENTIAGNYIGLNAAGTAALPNAAAGVILYDGAQDNMIGGSEAGAGNVISGNRHEGLGLAGTNTTGNQVLGNFIGLNAAGSSALPNGWAGVALFSGASSNVVGRAIGSGRNVISGNQLQGLTLSDPGTCANLVAGNWIGLNAAGTAALPNGWAGVQLFGGACRNRIGGTTPGARNIISGNSFQGVVVNGAATVENEISGNYIGLNPAGTAAMPNGWSGIDLFDLTAANVIGGLEPGAGNVIAGNTQYAIIVRGTANRISGNWIGLDATGNHAIGNGWSGVALLDGARSNIIGGAIATAANVISGNANYGLSVSGTNTTENVIQGNWIGLDSTGSLPVANGWDGIAIYDGASRNTVGRSLDDTGAGNHIAFNAGAGLVLFDPQTTGNSLRGNHVFANGSLGINLIGGTEEFTGVTPNDAGDADAGPNHLQNYPAITSAVAHAPVTVVTGTFSGAARRRLVIDAYRSDAADASGYGEGREPAGRTVITTDDTGLAAFTVTFPGGASGQFVTATATDLDSGDTSEFSASQPIAVGPASPVFTAVPLVTATGVVAEISLTPGQSYRIQAATNLGASPIEWQDLTNFTATATSLRFFDRLAPPAGQRFYRVASP